MLAVSYKSQICTVLISSADYSLYKTEAVLDKLFSVARDGHPIVLVLDSKKTNMYADIFFPKCLYLSISALFPPMLNTNFSSFLLVSVKYCLCYELLAQG